MGERAMILERGEPLRLDDLGTSLAAPVPAGPAVPAREPLALDAVVPRHIASVLEMTGA